MPESIEHQKLKQEAVQTLISKGFEKDKILIDKRWIEVNYHGHNYKFRVDVYATNDEEIAVECGNFPKWKQPIYEQYFGKEFVIHLPYPPQYGKYLMKDVEEGRLDKKQATQFLIDSYKKYIYDVFKDDPIFDFQEFNEENRGIFNVDSHRTYRELNADYSTKPEELGRNIWMNFPDSGTLSKEEYGHNIHWGMIYYTKNKFGVTIFFSGRETCEKFLSFSENTHKKIYNALINLPPNFFIRDGNSFWEKTTRPPLDKEYNDPIPCHELSWEDYQNILNNLDNLIELQKNGNKVGPVIDLAKVFCTDDELPIIIEEFKELYSILLKSETKIDVIAENIKELDSWEWYVSQMKEWDDFYKDYIKNFDEISLADFKKACRKLRSDPQFIKYMKD